MKTKKTPMSKHEWKRFHVIPDSSTNPDVSIQYKCSRCGSIVKSQYKIPNPRRTVSIFENVDVDLLGVDMSYSDRFRFWTCDELVLLKVHQE